jgi:hypothetical protein
VIRKHIPYGTKLPVYFSKQELEDIRERTFMDPDFGLRAIVEGKRFGLDLSLDDIEDIQGYVAAEANHTRDTKLRKRLDRLFDKFQKYLDEYDDQSED